MNGGRRLWHCVSGLVGEQLPLMFAGVPTSTPRLCWRQLMAIVLFACACVGVVAIA